jgi:hypothetical protein
MKTVTVMRRIASRRNFGFLLIVALAFVYPYLISAQNTNSSSNTNRDANPGVNANLNPNANLSSNTNGNLSGTRSVNTNSNPGGGGAAAAKTPQCPPAPDAPPSTITDVYKETKPQPTPTPASGTPAPTPTPAYTSRIRDVELGDVIVVEGDFKTLLDRATCEKKNVVLYLDDRPLKDVTAYPPTDPAEKFLRFTLKRTEDSREVWTYLLGQPPWGPRVTKVSIGIVDEFAVSSEHYVNLQVISHGYFAFWVILFILLVIGFLVLAFKSNLLRDSVASPDGNHKRPWSLARTQAAWWFFLVLASYLFIGIITGDFGTTITSTVLGLIGISAGTAVGAAVVDASKESQDATATQTTTAQEIQARLTQLEIEIAQAKAALTANPNDPAAAQTLATLTKEKEEKSSQFKKLTNQSESFLLDILSDANGVSFHRFQMAAWTLVLGIIFIFQVYKVLAMPDFNSSLLALLGISAGTYIGLKIPEPTVPQKKS